MISHSKTLESTKQQTVFVQDTTKELQTEATKEVACVKQVGFIDKGTGKHQSNAVYSQEDLSPTIYASVEKEPIKSLEIGTTHYPHGWLKENADFSGNCPTIDSGIWKHHTLLIEKGKYE